MSDQASVRHRSPAYPAVGLRNAVDRLRNLYTKDGKAGAPANLAAIHIGFGKAHGQALSVLAALKKFGLINEVGGRFAPSQRGIEILNLPTGDPRRQRALQEAVLEPSIYRELIEQHRETGWPADDVLASELVTYKQFNPKAVNGFVEDLRDSLEFAGLSKTPTLESEEEIEGMPLSEIQEVPPPGTEQFAKTIAKRIIEDQEISLPVGMSEDGGVIFAHVRFDGGIKKQLIANLRALLEAMEKPLP